MSPEPPDTLVCLITTPRPDAHRIASAAVAKGLAACVNVVPHVQSVYRWEGEVQESEEALLVLKTTRSAVAELEGLLREIHPYETFELVCLDIVAGSHPYIDWIAASVDR
ncbi:MAG TPA: divalent-cation tolerance protein CutA [Solirubrobacteraceae bacterium]|jgi:periplasmic divalent cation tolerance protein|nr:divalent-cation tolerance protein CutA [Solirubrobacteraceae bacterium]